MTLQVTQSPFIPFSLNLHGRLHEFDRPQVAAIINVTPDSFYAGSRAIDEGAIARRVEQIVEEGADMIDIGAYSSRPGAADVTPEEETGRLSRGMRLLRQIAPDIPVSVDTFRADVARAAIEEMGADIINDISGGELDNAMFDTVASLGVPYIIMHMRGTPATMSQFTDYPNGVTTEVITSLASKVRQLSLMGISDVIVDPGFGFSKDTVQNYTLLHELGLFSAIERPLLVGISRKSMITRALGISSEDALNGTTVLNTLALLGGASILRVHDVKEARQAVTLVKCADTPQSAVTR